MNNELEKAKSILQKHFCFMQWQVEEARKNGFKIMSSEDIKYLISLDGNKKEKMIFWYSDFNYKKRKYKLEKLLKRLPKFKEKGYEGIILDHTISDDDKVSLEKNGCFIHQTGSGSVLWDEIYFTEEYSIKSGISYFKNLFSGLASVSYCL